MMYEITQDCRIGNVDYKKGQIVSKEEVGGLFFSVMKESEAKTTSKKAQVEEAPVKENKTTSKKK